VQLQLRQHTRPGYRVVRRPGALFGGSKAAWGMDRMGAEPRDREQGGSERGAVSSWARERFGGAAGPLRRAVAAALAEAHRRALSAHVGSELRRTTRAYGMPMADIQHDAMVEYAGGVEGAEVFHPTGGQYRLVRVRGVVLYPWRYAADAAPVREARMRHPVSDVRRQLLGGGQPANLQLSLDDISGGDISGGEVSGGEVSGGEIDGGDPDLLTALAEAGQVVTVAYASSPGAGILRAYWGDAELVDGQRGLLVWHHLEELPAAAAPVESTVDSAGAGRFDAAELEEPRLAARPGEALEAGADDQR
jgi:hypothetical protein